VAEDTGWIVTYTGKKFYPLAPRIDDIDMRDIAHALSNICRFTGHCRLFYSVAQHSLLGMHYAPHWLKASMLLHDAAEAYLCDVARPVKHSPGMTAYRAAEQRLQTLIGQRFDVSFDDPLIHEIDDRLLMTERRDLMNDAEHSSAESLARHHPPYPEEINPITTPSLVEWGFFETARELGLV
jgi:hypothetical protein